MQYFYISIKQKFEFIYNFLVKIMISYGTMQISEYFIINTVHANAHTII